MKKFFEEFKKFIMRGNVVDMAVGVIVGSSFTAVVNGMSNFILKPIINWLLALILGADSLSGVVTMLKPAYDATGVIDLANSIYIDWGSFINAVINFFLVALVLFTIVKLMNKLRDMQKDLDEHMNKNDLTKEDKKILKSRGVKLRDKTAVAAYIAEKEKAASDKAAAEKAAAEEAARLEREANPTTEDLLKSILAELKKN
ncbi:MAG: large conductance mechanosensitive channel protein MscL [Clostridia bacterium]|nr:large conductance mechanosensitive channel protein MscL [Clostridia bacterium]